jgi:hypothetical protein
VPCTPRVPSPDVFEHRPAVHAERFGMGRHPKTFTKPDIELEILSQPQHPRLRKSYSIAKAQPCREAPHKL